MTKSRKIVLFVSVVLMLVWAVLHLRNAPAGSDADWFVRLTLGCLLAFGLLASRPRAGSGPGWFDRHRGWLPVLAVVAALTSILGLIVPVRQFEWIGMVLLLYVALRWALPPYYRRNILEALFLLYWVHPLPSQVFGPFQMGMQQLAISGSEWLLHIANHRIWADGFILRIGLVEFGVPEECSGMRTAVTVLLCTLGVGLLLRMKIRETLVFLVLSVAQVLALNILRISAIVHLSVRQGVEISPTVLHDTAGIFLLIAIGLVQAEMVWWKQFSTKRRLRLHGIANGEVEPPRRSSFLPRFWYVLVRSVVWVLAVVFVAGTVSFAAYKRRPFHRANMIRGVAETLMLYRPEIAARAARAALAFDPGDRELMVLHLEALVRGGQYAEGLRVVESLPEPLAPLELAMKSWALAGVDRMEEALTIIQGLPERLAHQPGMAIFRAEYAARLDNPVEAGKFTSLAARSHMALPRVRALFPYLASRDQWMAIADSRHRSPHQNLDQALIDLHANFAVNRPEVAARILRQAVTDWPLEMRLLGSLAKFAAGKPGSDWETFFEEGLRHNLERLDADRLASLIGDSFAMRRPDLAWLAYRRLSEIDPSDPALYLTAARHVHDWFVFRKRHVEMRASDAFETVDMRDTFRSRRADPAFKPHWDRVPLAAEMIDNKPDDLRLRYLKRCVEELARREREGGLSRRMEQSYPVALGMLGETDEAHARLDGIAEKYPDLRSEVLLQQALNYERRAQWQLSYEALRQHVEELAFPGLQPRLMRVNAVLNMGMGLLALQAAADTLAAFPDAPEATLAAAFAWDAFGFKEQAVFMLMGQEWAPRMPSYPQLLFDSGRPQEARRRARALGVRLREGEPTSGRVVPAELTVRRRTRPPLSGDWLTAAALSARRLEAEADSPYLKALRSLEAEWFEAGGEGAAVSDPDRWFGVGRDAAEQAAAGYGLAVLLIQRGDFDAALAAARRAADLLPDAVVLWRLCIALSEGDAALIAQARARHPADPEIWLADLVMRRQRLDTSDRQAVEALQAELLREVRAAAAARRFAPGEMVRAADFLLRLGMPVAAEVAARHAIEHGQGLETAYVVGLHCAIQQRDIKWALSCALGGADHARDPKPFYQMLVNINFARGALDRDLVVALEYLRQQFPNDPEWAEKLGYVHFMQGDPGRALSLLGPVIRGDDVRGAQVETLLLAAESARLAGRRDHAISILEAASGVYPDAWTVRNNLVFTLAQDPQTQDRALALLPELLHMAPEAPEALDTAAVVYLRHGRLDRAEYYLKKALVLTDESMYSYPYLLMHKAELAAAQGDLQGAMRQIKAVVDEPAYRVAVGAQARQVMDRIGRELVDRDLRDARILFDAGEHQAAREKIAGVLRSPYAGSEHERESRRLMEQLRSGVR